MHPQNNSASDAGLVPVLLYGSLRRRFGRGHRLAVRSPAEAIRALCSQVKGFKSYLTEHSASGYRVFVGKVGVFPETMHLVSPPSSPIRIVPVVGGAGPGGSQVLLGAALIALSFAIPGSGTLLAQALMSAGIAMVVGGVVQMLSPQPKQNAPTERPENAPSYLFDGAVNTTGQGNPVPIGYGRLMIGSQVISAGLSVEQIAIVPPDVPPVVDDGDSNDTEWTLPGPDPSGDQPGGWFGDGEGGWYQTTDTGGE